MNTDAIQLPDLGNLTDEEIADLADVADERIGHAYELSCWLYQAAADERDRRLEEGAAAVRPVGLDVSQWHRAEVAKGLYLSYGLLGWSRDRVALEAWCESLHEAMLGVAGNRIQQPEIYDADAE